MPEDDKIKRYQTVPVTGAMQTEIALQKMIQDFGTQHRFTKNPETGELEASDYQGISPFNFTEAAYIPSKYGWIEDAAGSKAMRYNKKPLTDISEGDFDQVLTGDMKPYELAIHNTEETPIIGNEVSRKKRNNLLTKAKAVSNVIKNITKSDEYLMPRDWSEEGLKTYIDQMQSKYNQAHADIKGKEFYKKLEKQHKKGEINNNEFVAAIKRNNLERFTPGYYEDDSLSFSTAMDQQYAENQQKFVDGINLAGELTGIKPAIRVMDNPGETVGSIVQTGADLATLATLGSVNALLGNDPSINPITGEKYFANAGLAADALTFLPAMSPVAKTVAGTGKKIKSYVSPTLYNSSKGIKSYINKTSKNLRIEEVRTAGGNTVYKMLKKDKNGNWKEIEIPGQGSNSISDNDLQNIIESDNYLAKSESELKQTLTADGVPLDKQEEIINFVKEIKEGIGDLDKLKKIKGTNFYTDAVIKYRDDLIDEAFVRYNTGTDRDPFNFGSPEADLQWRLASEGRPSGEGRLLPDTWKNMSQAEKAHEFKYFQQALKDRPDTFVPETLIQNEKTLRDMGVSLPYFEWRKLDMIDNNQFLSGIMSMPTKKGILNKMNSSVGNVLDGIVNKFINTSTRAGFDFKNNTPNVKEEWDQILNYANEELAKGIEIKGKRNDIGIKLESSGVPHLRFKVNVDKFLKNTNDPTLTKHFEELIADGHIILDEDGFFQTGRISFKSPQQAGVARNRTFSEILKGESRKVDTWRTPGRSAEEPFKMYGKSGDFPFDNIKWNNKIQESIKDAITSDAASAKSVEALKRGAKKVGQEAGTDIAITSGGTGHSDEGMARYLSGVKDLGGKDLYSILGADPKFLKRIEEIKADNLLMEQLQSDIRFFKSTEQVDGLFKELKNLGQGTTFLIKKYGGPLNANQYGLGSYMAPQDLDPETMKRYLADLRILENSVKAGYKGGKWYPHKSYEGGMPTIGYGHKVVAGEDFSKGLTEAEAKALQKKDVLKHQTSAKSKIDAKFGKGTFDSLPQESQMLAVDYEYNGVLNQFPSFTKALVAGDKATMLKEFPRHSGGNPLKERNTWTEGVINEFESGGKFSNAGFKALPLHVQNKIMRSSNKFEAGGLDVVDPKNVQEIMNKLYQESNTSGYAGNDPSEFMMPNTTEYDTEYQAMISGMSGLAPTDDYIEIGGKTYSAEDYFAAIKANPPSSFYMPTSTTQGAGYRGAARYDKPPVLSSSYVPPAFPSNTTTISTTPDSPKIYTANTGEVMEDRPPIDPNTGQPLTTDYSYSQFISQAANDPERLQAKADQKAAMEANIKALEYLTEDEQARARKEGLTATEYTEKYRPKAEDMKVLDLPGGFKYGGNMYPNGGGNSKSVNPIFMRPSVPSVIQTQSVAGPSADYPSMYVDKDPLNNFNDLDLSSIGERQLNMMADGRTILLSSYFNPNYIPFENGEAYYDKNLKDTGLPAYEFSDNISDKSKQALQEKVKAELTSRQKANGGNMYPTGGMMSNKYAMGAQMPQGQMTDIPVTEFNAGGTHEANAMGGVLQGVDSTGTPNLVEEGELKITIPGTDEQFIVSPKIKLDKTTAEEFGLNKKYVGKDMVKIFKSILRQDNFNQREGDSIVENSKQLQVMPYVEAHAKLTEIKNAEDAAKKQEAFDKDMGQMMKKHPEYMEALLAPKEQGGPSPEEAAMMQQQMAQMEGAPGGMPPMMRNGGMYAYGGNMYNFGSTLGAGVAGAAKGVLGSIPGIGGILEGGVDAIHGALDKDITEQDKIAMGVGETVGAAGTAAVTGGATLASGMDNMIGGATEAAANIPGMGEGGQAFLEGANQLSGLASMIPMRNGGMKGGCGRGCNCFKCGGKMHTYGGNMFTNGSFTPSQWKETLDYVGSLADSQTKGEGEEDKIMNTTLEEGIKDVTVEGGYLSALKAAPLITSGIMAFSPAETYNAGDLGYKATTAPKIDYGQAKKDIQQQTAGVAKDLRNAGTAGYKSNRLAAHQNAMRATANISMQEENTNKQLAYQNALQNAGRYQEAAARAKIMNAQAEAAKGKAIQDFGIGLGSFGAGISRDYLEAGMANMYSSDIDMNYRMLGNSFLGGVKTNKDRAAKDKKKNKSNK